jgi:hypothetical protein
LYKVQKKSQVFYVAFTFLLLQKSNKKGAPKWITSPFRVGSLI